MTLSKFKNSNFPISDLKFRHFRFRLGNKFVKIRKKIRSEQELFQLIEKMKPDDAYYSTSTFLFPERLGAKGTDDAHFLKNDLAFDIDAEDGKPLESARKETLKLLDYLKSKEIKIKYIAFSGSKGFHIVCENLEIKEPDAEKREDAYAEHNKKIVKEITDAGIRIDTKITLDTRRILRIPGTINSKSGLKCTLLNEQELKSQNHIFKNVNRINNSSPKIPLLGNDHVLRTSRRISGWLNRIGARSPPKHIQGFISSSVPETNLSIVILKHLKKKRIELLLTRLQKTYLLPTFYVFQQGEWQYSICFKPLPRDRILKILKAAGSVNLSQFLKYGQTYFPVGRKREENMKIIEPQPELEFVVNSKNHCKLSRAHTSFFISFGLDIENGDVGGEDLEFFYGVFE